MKLIKLNEQHYIVVDDSEIKDVRPYKGRWHYEKGVAINQFPTYLTDLSECKLITHSTQPLGFLNEDGITTANLKPYWSSVKPLSLSEVEEAINGYSVDELYAEHKKTFIWEPAKESSFHFKAGFNAHKELVKDKLFTVEETIEFTMNMISQYVQGNTNVWNREILKESLIPKTEWEVTFDEQGKLKLNYV